MAQREIKFRVWEIYEKRFVEYYFLSHDVVHVAIGDQYYLCNNLNASEEHKADLIEKNIEIRDEFILLQYTGLKDKNGKEIYEGDILVHIGFPNQKVKVYFDEGAFYCNKILTSTYYSSVIEIIGNIYEHPELLK